MATKENKRLYSGNRYAADMEQAEAMRRSLSSSSSSSRRLGNSEGLQRDDKKRLTMDDINMALRGLEEAEAQRDKGNTQSSLRIYELSLEILILFLKDEENFKRIPNIEPSTVAARVSVALSDAEKLKAQTPKVATTTPSQSSIVSGMISSLTTALMGTPKAPVAPSVTVDNAPKSPKKTHKTSASSKLSKKDNSVAAAHSSPNSTQSQTSPKTALRLGDPVKDQLYKAVLDDFFVESSAVQETSWDDVAGLDDVKQALQESAILPLVRPDLFTGLRKPQNILLWGPPGTGKTMLVRAVAKESGSSLFVCSASSLTSKWMGEAEKLVKALFQVAREVSPSIIFLDEVDAVLSRRKSDGEHEASRRLKTEFMVQMDGITGGENRVLVLACTNCPWDIDSAVLRRFPRRIFVPLPDAAARSALLKILLKKAGKHSIKKKSQRDALVKRLEGFSCSDITAIASEASFGPIRALGGLAAVRGAKATDVRPVTIDDFDEAIRKATKSVSETQQQKFENWRREQSSS